jgi:hypothetical protein
MPILLMALLGHPLFAQIATINNGTLTVSEGTRVTFMSPLELVIEVNGGVVNHGLIELREGRVSEPEGGPITGNGTETAFVPLPGGSFDEEPGGMGLGLSGTAVADTLFVERGHQPIVVNGTISSVARWFELRTTGSSSGQVTAVMRIDPTELNGITSDLLELHRAEALQGPWVPLPSTVDQGLTTVASEVELSGHFLTAFRSDIMTAIATPPGAETLVVWPTITSEVVHVRSVEEGYIRAVEVFDMSGSRISHVPSGTSGSTWSMNVANLNSGVYILRVNGTFNLRFIRP